MDLLFAIALPPGWQIALVLALLVLAVVLFALESVSVDLLTLGLLLALVGLGILTPREAFAGFSEEVIIMLASIFVIGGALQETGALDAVGAKLIKLAGGGENRLLFLLMAFVSALSAFMNNTTVTAMCVGPVMALAAKTKISPSKILLPLAYASILGGTCTLIGTSTNIAVSGYIVREQMQPLGFFEITPIGLIIVAVGIAYMMVLGKRLLPAHRDESLTEDFAIRDYLSEIVVMPGSPLIGQRVFRSELSKLDFRILKVIRGPQQFVPNDQSFIQEADLLLVTGNIENLMKVKTTEGIEIKADLKIGDQDLQYEDTKIAEALVTPQSNLAGRTLKETNYQQEYGLTVLAVHRRGRPLREKIGAIKLKVGDLLLVQGRQERIAAIKRKRELAVLEELGPAAPRHRKSLFAVGIFAAAIVASGFNLLPPAVCFLAAAVLIVLFRCLPAERIYETIDWRLLILIGGMTAFGTAMDKTGADKMLATSIVGLLKPLGPMWILAGFFALTILLTQPMSNAAAALVVLPVALETARALGVNERTFAIGIMLAASVSFIAPFEPSCLLVYGPGKYRFMDFVKTGVLLTLVLAVTVLIFLPIFWPLHPAR